MHCSKLRSLRSTPRIKNLGCTSRAGHAPARNVWSYGCIGKHDMNECVDASMPFISCHLVGNITNIPLENISHKEECTQEARSKSFFGHSRKEDNLLPKPCKTKDSLRPQHATNWEILCINWAEHLLIGKSIQRDMLNKASRQDARPTPSF